jgi:hypothetical protein
VKTHVLAAAFDEAIAVAERDGRPTPRIYADKDFPPLAGKRIARPAEERAVTNEGGPK